MDQEILEKVCNSINPMTNLICVLYQTLVVEHKGFYFTKKTIGEKKNDAGKW